MKLLTIISNRPTFICPLKITKIIFKKVKEDGGKGRGREWGGEKKKKVN